MVYQSDTGPKYLKISRNLPGTGPLYSLSQLLCRGLTWIFAATKVEE